MQQLRITGREDFYYRLARRSVANQPLVPPGNAVRGGNKSTRTSCVIILLILAFSAASWAEPIWISSHPQDAALCVNSLPDISGDGLPEIVAGFDSGLVTCLSAASVSPAIQIWNTEIGSSILDLLPLPDANGDDEPELVLSSDTGLVTCIHAGETASGEVLWSFACTCNVSVLTLMPDINEDEFPEVVASGADHRVHVRNGRTGAELWTRELDTPVGRSYVHQVASDNDLNDDTYCDVVVWTWDGYLWALNGTNGEDLWKAKIDQGFTEAMTSAGDLNGDNVSDFLTGGNGKTVRLCSGKNGTVIWNCPLTRPIRDVLVASDVSGDGLPDCFGITAGGVVASITGTSTGSILPLWTAEMGDVCRVIVSPGDVDGDSRQDVTVCAENGRVATFSGVNGHELWRWTGPDVIRDLCVVEDIDGDDISDVVAASLDGSVALLPGATASWSSVPPARFGEGLVLKEPFPLCKPHYNRSQSLGSADEVPILLYHDVLPEAIYTYSVSVDQFREQMDLLVQGDYTCVSLDQIADWIDGSSELSPNPVCITFDGPYDGHHTHAYPILEERDLFAISYITADWIGTANHLDWHQLREMNDVGIGDIQNHTINHPNLTTLDHDGVVQQLQECNNAIFRRMGGKLVTHHAYPGGAYTSVVMDTLRDMGFRTATSTVARPAVRTDDPMALPRYCILKSTSLSSFKSMVQYETDTQTPTPTGEWFTPTPTATHPPIETLPYEFAGTVGTGWNTPSYAELDAQGNLWVCDYAGKRVRIFGPGGNELAFSPIAHGLDPMGETVAMEAPSGIAITPAGNVLVSVCDYFGESQYLGLFRYAVTDGQALSGLKLPYKPGDLDCDVNGLVYIVDKVVDKWHVYGPDLAEISGSPFGLGTTDHVQRGISVRPDSARVYVISEDDLAVHVWHGEATADVANYVQGPDLVSDLSARSGGVDVMDDGTVLVGYDSEGSIHAFDSAHNLLGQIQGGTPPMAGPRGTAFTADGSVIWVTCTAGFMHRWERKVTAAGFWLGY